MAVPDLAQGLRLENRRRVLRWGRAPETLRRVARPRESEGDLTFNYSPLLVWNDVRVLGGLRATVTVPLRRKRFLTAQVIPWSSRAPLPEFRRVNAHLEKALDRAPRLEDDGWCPSATWRVGPVKIVSELRDKNGLYHVLLLSRRLTPELPPPG